MLRASSIVALLTFLTFFGGGFIILVSFLVGGMGLVPQIADGLTLVLSLFLILPLSKHLFTAIGLDEDPSRKLAVLTGMASVVVFYLTIPGACGGCHP